MEKLKKIFASFIVVCLLTANISFGATTKLNTNAKLEVTKEFEDWTKLSEEEKAKTKKIPNPYTIEIKNSILRSKFKALLKGETSSDLGEKFNLAEEITINVKDQSNTGACWAFATVSAVETFMAMRDNNIFDTYSPSHMDYTMAANSFTDGINEKGLNRYANSGGNSTLAGAYLTSGKGLVLEEDFPFVDGVLTKNEKGEDVNNYEAEKIKLEQIEQKVSKVVKEYRMFPDIIKKVANGELTYYNSADQTETYTEADVEAIRKEMKQFIKTKGAITGSMSAYKDFLNVEKVESGEAEEYAFFSDGRAPMNHAITIVGWDDTYSKENFNDMYKPVNDGAWIILNSWGTSPEKYTNEGYMYVSYDDAWIEYDMMGIEEVTEVDYENLYEHDEFGMTNSLYLETRDIWLANIYNSKQKGIEELKEIGIFLAGTQNVEVYANVTGSDFSKLEKVAEPGILEPGYKTIKLTTPKTITGDNFIVAVRYTNSEGIELPLELDWNANGIPVDTYDSIKAENGQSYVSLDGVEYYDLLNIDWGNEQPFILKDANLCIKAYTGSKEPAKAQSITLDKQTIALEEGNTETITATVSPAEAQNKEVTYTSEEPTIATVDENGNVTAVAEGTTTITVASKEVPTVKATCEVTVFKKGDFALQLDKTTATMNVGEELTLTPTFTPATVENKAVTWETSDEEIATVDANGKVAAIAAGKATITVTSVANPEKTATCEITVTDKISVESVSINIVEKELKVGETVQLTATVAPANATDKTVTWETSNKTIADVDTTGKVTAKAAGTATITVTTNDGGKTATSTITVVNKETGVKVESIKLNKTQVQMQVGDKTSLVVTFTPSNATNKNVTWEIDNKSVATVDKNGIITAVGKGTAKLTVTTEDGNKTAVATITVTEKTNTDDDIYKPNQNEQDSSEEGDSTTVDGNLPFSGKTTIFAIVIMIAGYGIIKIIKYRKLKDVK